MPTWLVAIWAGIVSVLTPLINALLAWQAGKEAEKQKARADAEQATLDSLDKADEAAAAARGWSRDDRLRYFEQRRRLRDLP